MITVIIIKSWIKSKYGNKIVEMVGNYQCQEKIGGYVSQQFMFKLEF